MKTFVFSISLCLLHVLSCRHPSGNSNLPDRRAGRFEFLTFTLLLPVCVAKELPGMFPPLFFFLF
ncbi:Uncharacterized protein APZ42_022593 [Daphnia magna]|uniref:Uncharacterized protein n=1 Tax=Daphnia magna TaxID=35525 RepID=A0A164VMH9_9CRUS|nr:Uncharacterized protein APZ42_022593 [Daphnia magna]